MFASVSKNRVSSIPFLDNSLAVGNHWTSSAMNRLNSGNRNGYNFFVFAIFIFQKSENDSVNYADSGDIKILVQFPGSSILKF